MHCLVGLGNPGAEYAATRHNVGWQVADELARHHGLEISRRRLRSHFGRGSIAGQDCLLVKPQTFMNDSGDAVARVLMYFRLPATSVLLMYDDINLDLGVMRFRRGGSDGGHKGVRSVIHHLHTQDLARLRLGIGRPPAGANVMHYVLTPFARSEDDRRREMVEQAAEAVERYLREGMSAAMNAYNS
jgi:PTH1 family peptidyl-tRNA hydrolase